MFTPPLHAVAALLYALGFATAQVQNPTGERFHRRALGAVAVLGDYLYIEGGEVSQQGDGKGGSGNFSRPFNLTLSLPLGSAWKTSDVELKEIDRGNKPPIKFNSLWADEDNKKIYQYDGEGSKGDAEAAISRKLWVLDVDNEGGGKWTTTDSPRGSQGYRKAQAASVVCNGTAYSLGGFTSPVTDARIPGARSNTPAVDMLSFNMADKAWGQSTLDTMSPPNGVFLRGMASCVEGIGESPFIFTSGGAVSSRTAARTGVRPLDPTTITFYDIESKTWLSQKATGSPPSAGIWQHCMVGVKSPLGTYELFVYGGYNDEKASLSDVWVLTLPGFHWMNVASSRTPRAYHSCAVAGKRHMIVVGGIPGSSSDAWAWDEKDEWASGIGVFDLAKVEWSDQYDPNAGEYRTPESVQKWYTDGGMKDIEWSSDKVKAIFSSMKLEFEDTNTGGSSKNNSGAESGDANDPPEPTSSTPVGAIVGGVVGGIAALGALAAAIFFFRRSRRLRRQRPYPVAPEVEQPFTTNTSPAAWSPPTGSKNDFASPGPVEVEGSGRYYEMPAGTGNPSELEGSDYGSHMRK